MVCFIDVSFLFVTGAELISTKDSPVHRHALRMSGSLTSLLDATKSCMLDLFSIKGASESLTHICMYICMYVQTVYLLVELSSVLIFSVNQCDFNLKSYCRWSSKIKEMRYFGSDAACNCKVTSVCGCQMNVVRERYNVVEWQSKVAQTGKAQEEYKYAQIGLKNIAWLNALSNKHHCWI